MDNKIFLAIPITMIIVGVVFSQNSESMIPPTAAIKTIIVNGETYTATNYAETLLINSTGDISLTLTNNQITLKLNAIDCGQQTLTGIDANGNFVCSTP